MKSAIKFELALLHIIHWLMDAKNEINDQERKIIQLIREEENISESVCKAFEASLSIVNKKIIQERSIALLGQCSKRERLRAFVQLSRLANAYKNLDMKEVCALFSGVNTSQNTSNEAFSFHVENDRTFLTNTL